ncbi:unnamed protein product [Trichogramma brassicae]|uniref:RNA-directed DNA polymerase n=1 Tax=Trichogramma brassicae TaxID=86971 RepID=A0A6H5IPQ8_9HYME|nr:unnamed protein product [Trichogramma brassicae]
MQLAWIYKEDMPRVCGKRKRESVGEVATTPDTDNRTSLIASDEQKREAHHQAESLSTVSDNQPLDAKIVVESIRDVPPELSAEQTGQYVIDANANVANQLVESPDKDNNQINIVENESSEVAELCSTALSDRNDTNLHARWWLEIVVGKSKIRAMLDSGATHTITGPLGLQLASECESRVMPTFGVQAKANDGRTESIIGRAELPVQVAGVTHTLNVALVNSMDDECLLGADFYRTFNAIVHPRENLLQIEGASERVALEAVTSGKSSRICLLQISLSETVVRTRIRRTNRRKRLRLGRSTDADHRRSRGLCFASRTLNKAERNYSVTERECLAVLWAIQKFRPYVEGYRFRVITDHSSLRWLHNLRNPTGKLSRWSLELQQFDYIVEHRKGTNNVVPDALSRLYEDESDEAQVASIIINEKAEDSWYNKLLTKVKADPTKYPCHKAIGSTLYHYRPDPFIDDVVDDQDTWKLIVPKDKKQQVLSECHEEPTAGHLGRHKTYQRLAMRYYWPSAHRDVTKYVRECQICQQCKVQQLAPAGLMGRRAITRPWSVVAGHTMGPFPRSAQGNEYIIISIDLFT